MKVRNIHTYVCVAFLCHFMWRSHSTMVMDHERRIPQSTLNQLRGILISSLSRENLGALDHPETRRKVRFLDSGEYEVVNFNNLFIVKFDFNLFIIAFLVTHFRNSYDLIFMRTRKYRLCCCLIFYFENL